jgi:hypothetical protein
MPGRPERSSERREVSLSSMRFSRNDGKPFTDDDILSVFPPREFLGLQFEHRSGEHAGRALWMFGNSDVDEPCWVLMAIMVSARAQKMARCTIVCRNESDMEWAGHGHGAGPHVFQVRPIQGRTDRPRRVGQENGRGTPVTCTHLNTSSANRAALSLSDSTWLRRARTHALAPWTRRRQPPRILHDMRARRRGAGHEP